MQFTDEQIEAEKNQAILKHEVHYYLLPWLLIIRDMLHLLMYTDFPR